MIQEQEGQNYEMYQLKRDKNDILSEMKELEEERISELESQVSLLGEQLKTAYR
jgi:hypothetical protein